MLPSVPDRVGGSRKRPPCGSVPPENTKDIIIIYEDDAEEWALYLRKVFLHVVKSAAILLYCLENFSLRDLELLSLNSYRCKLLILSDNLLKDLTLKKRQFLEKVLHSPESVVTLLCGVKSSDQLYKLLNISGGRWEISTEQGPEDYISVIKGIIFGGSEDYLQVDFPTDLRVEHSGEVSEIKEIEELSESSRSTIPLALVLPTEISCENPGEIFIILRDEVMGTVEVEFTSNNKCIRTHPTLWNKTVWCMKALDFPAGSVNVNIYCDGVVKATTEIQYCTTEKTMESLGVAGPGNGVHQNDIKELDDILTSIFKHEIPCYEFRSLQTEIFPQKEYTHFRELPTLLHCAAKFGLKNLAIHLLQCSGATWASKMKNLEGSDPAHIAERHGHKELKKIFEDFSIQELGRNNDQEYDYVEDITSFYKYFPSTQDSTFHHESGQPHRQSAGRAEANERAKEEKENESGTKAECSPPEVCSRSSKDQNDDLYMFIPGDSPENNPQESLMSIRPPLPPPRPVAATFQLEKPPFTLQARKTLEGQTERSQSWCDVGARQDTGGEPQADDEKAEDEKEQEEEEDPYTFTELDDNEYEMILAHMSTKKKLGNRSFLINRPPAPTPRPTNVPQKEETTPYIAQVFQQKAARRQSDGDRLLGPKKQDRARMESSVFSATRSCLAAGQEELILLQEKVKNGKLSVDQALEKFKHWQIGKTGLEMFQQEKLRQLRDCIIGKRPEEENVYNKLTIVHHPNGNESVHNENILYSIPFGNKLPPRLQVDKEFGFCCKKDH